MHSDECWSHNLWHELTLFLVAAYCVLLPSAQRCIGAPDKQCFPWKDVYVLAWESLNQRFKNRPIKATFDARLQTFFGEKVVTGTFIRILCGLENCPYKRSRRSKKQNARFTVVYYFPWNLQVCSRNRSGRSFPFFLLLYGI